MPRAAVWPCSVWEVCREHVRVCVSLPFGPHVGVVNILIQGQMEQVHFKLKGRQEGATQSTAWAFWQG